MLEVINQNEMFLLANDWLDIKQLLFLLTKMKHPEHEGAVAAGVDEDLISLLMNDPVLLCRRPLRPTETRGNGTEECRSHKVI